MVIVEAEWPKRGPWPFGGYLERLGLGAAELARHAAAVPLRPGAGELLAWCTQRGLRVRVVSEGLDAYVLPVLARMGAPEVEVSCNRLVEGPGGARILPPPDGEPRARCLNCKGAHARRGRAGGMRVAIVGNGASDLCAAREADLVLARDTLALLCRAEGIPCQPWDDLAEVRAAIEAAV